MSNLRDQLARCREEVTNAAHVAEKERSRANNLANDNDSLRDALREIVFLIERHPPTRVGLSDDQVLHRISNELERVELEGLL